MINMFANVRNVVLIDVYSTGLNWKVCGPGPGDGFIANELTGKKSNKYLCLLI